MIEAIIVDDEKMARTALSFYAKKSGSVVVMAEFSSAMEARSYLKDNKIDVVFLDIQMPRLTGIEFLSNSTLESKIVLVSSDPSYGPSAFELGVFDYLQKPIDYDKFLKCISKLKSELEKDIAVDHFSIKVDGEFIKIKMREILAVSTVGDYVKIFLLDGKTYLTHSSLRAFLKRLNSNFVQVHQSHVVNKNRLEKFNGTHVQLTGLTIPVSRTYKSLVKTLI